MADKVIPMRPPPAERLFYLHSCKNGLFQLRDDGKIICYKCGEVVGEWREGVM